jgi:hypothetical protein
MPLSYLPKCAAQFVDVFRQQSQPSIRQIDGEEEAASGNEVATIAGHACVKMMGFAKSSTHPTSWAANI